MYIDIEIIKKKKESLLPEDEYSKYIFNKINELRKNRNILLKKLKKTNQIKPKINTKDFLNQKNLNFL